MTTLRTLECLVALIETGSVTKAAAKLHMSQPALSHQIAALERELETPVVQRLRRGVRPTAAGRAAVVHARATLEAAHRTLEVGREVGLGRAGHLRIACVETMTAWVLVPVLKRWRTRRPDVQLELEEFSSSDRMNEYLLSGNADFGVGPRPTSTSLQVEVLGGEEILVVCHAGHPFAGQASVAVTDLAGEPFVHYHQTNGNAVWVDELVTGFGVSLLPVMRTRSPRTAAHLAGAGMDVTIVPASALAGRPDGVARRFEPEIRRDVIVSVATPTDSLVKLFVADLLRAGLPSTPPDQIPASRPGDLSESSALSPTAAEASRPLS
jgi:DNA-binding transcriptional LysR family regulator